MFFEENGNKKDIKRFIVIHCCIRAAIYLQQKLSRRICSVSLVSYIVTNTIIMFHILKNLILILLFITISLTTFAQAKYNKQLICGKKWFCEKIQEADGTSYPPDKTQANEYSLYECDGSFVSIEQTITIKGKWTIDEKKGIITVTQNQTKKYPYKITSTIRKIDNNHLVISARDAGGSILTLYLYAKN